MNANRLGRAVAPTRWHQRARTRFTRPGTTSPVQRYTGTRASRAAMTTGSVTSPPLVQHAVGWKRAICTRASTTAGRRRTARAMSDVRESGSRSDGIGLA